MQERSSPRCLLILRTWVLYSACGQRRRVFHGRPDCKTLAVGSHRARQAEAGHGQCTYHHLHLRCQQKAPEITEHQKCCLRIDGNIAGHCASLLSKTVNGQKLTKRCQWVSLLRSQPHNGVESTRRGRNYRGKSSRTDIVNKNPGGQKENVVLENLPPGKPGVVLFTSNPSTQRSEGGGWWVQGQHKLCSEILSQFSVSHRKSLSWLPD